MVTIVTALGAAESRSARAADAVASTPAARAMWVWDTSTPAATVALASSQGITELYAAVPPHVDSSPQLAQLRDLSQRAAAAGIRVDALGGDPTWIDNQSWAVDSWLRPAIATGLFAGVHVDIEPYTTSAWTTSQAKVVKKWLATLDTLRTAAGATPMQADIPFWLDQVSVNGSTLDSEIIRRTSGVTVMAYRNTAGGADGSIALSAHAVHAGELLGRPVRIGAETDYLGTDPAAAKQTFYGSTRTAMEAQLSALAGAYAGSTAYAGLAIHDAAGYAAMAP
ncbi:hypothetical protein [Nostocoides sp. HKS02]|uniref:hypothetical protein n=1 Tax=Nostocoides sp. HKS02 TaxID=1813880 RepID=UPI0012B5019B|nr:hypothetical protein [Tetrasphaera sp. HKS02]QGN58200.1 hypothetical protein GKE56_10225 [Tetrasphaera sp. HKS02]